ncbi:hypothetical protein GGI55_001080 [Rhizobium leguminosarum]|nr:hypothetical protein [Rhizobium leguminosarum]MBB4431012.1 hypothetical protein [Rhizobium esperanzae]MBB4416021.1 hypothetical protein [Rhizobium leguminosarum]MBB4540372.1 hypothetical protein [Rhizobium leguminosarum]MBB5651235.1 hypothetical protein [Rhizobium leguminosarum]
MGILVCLLRRLSDHGCFGLKDGAVRLRYRTGDLPGDICLNPELVLSAKIGIEIIGPDDRPVCPTHQPGNGAQPASVRLDVALKRVVGSSDMITRRRIGIGDHDDVIELGKLADNIVPEAVGDIRSGIDGAALCKNLDSNRRRGGFRRQWPDKGTSRHKKCQCEDEKKKKKDGQQTGSGTTSDRRLRTARLLRRLILICKFSDPRIFRVFFWPSRHRRVAGIFEMRHVSAFRHGNNDVIRLACDEIITFQGLSYSARLDPDDRIILRVE